MPKDHRLELGRYIDYTKDVFAKKKQLNFDDLFNKVQQFASTAQQVTNPNNFNFDLDFSDIFQNSCFTGPIQCGPPSVVFYGGGGQGAKRNQKQGVWSTNRHGLGVWRCRRWLDENILR